MLDLPQMLTVRQVADILQVSERYVRAELIGKGRIRAIKLVDGGCWRIDAESVAKLVGRRITMTEKPEEYYRRKTALARAERGFVPRS